MCEGGDEAVSTVLVGLGVAHSPDFYRTLWSLLKRISDG